MKTPIIYYGGKTRMLKHILPLIPGDHRIYAEPFFGGGAVFFGKQKSEVEVINDNLDMVTNFYQVMKSDFDRLQGMIQRTLHAERAYLESKEIIKNPVGYTKLKRAWAFWAQAQLCFSHSICGGFAFAKTVQPARCTFNRKAEFTRELGARFEHVQIFCRDALDVIRKYDSPDTFYYLDPPYANSDCGHYNKGKDVFYLLLKLLPDLQGRWLMSSYPCPELDALRDLPGIRQRDIDQPIAVSGKHNAGKRKTECLTWNYQEPQP